MLQSLQIKNVAIISELGVDFNKGLTVISGETGSGKTVILSALNFLLGQRADKDLIKSGENFARVSGIFYFDDNKFNKLSGLLEEHNVDIADNQLLISREMYLGEGSVAKINNTIVTINCLKRLAENIIDIHGQNQSQKILNHKTHINILDQYDSSFKIVGRFEAELEKLKALDAKFDKLKKIEPEKLKMEVERLEFDINELEGVNLSEKKDEELENKIRKMQNSKQIKESVEQVQSILDNDHEFDIMNQLSNMIKLIFAIMEFDQDVRETHKRLDSIKIDLSDIYEVLQSKLEELEFDQEDYIRATEEFNELNRLKLKHNTNITGLVSKLYNFKKKVKEYIDSDNAYSNYQLEREKVLDKLYEEAIALSKHRKVVAKRLESDLELEMEDLGLKNARFIINFSDNKISRENFEKFLNSKGIDNVEFLFSSNKGEPVKRLAKIISGGEMSRLILAIKTLLGSNYDINTMFFDEIDTGVSGSMVLEIARKVYNISRHCQVILISHQPQLASMADNNTVVVKHLSSSKGIYISTKKLSRDDKISHIAEIIRGKNYTKKALENAEEMVSNADQEKLLRRKN